MTTDSVWFTQERIDDGEDLPGQGEVPPARAWQRMLSGRRLDLLNPSPLDIEIEDIAHGLSRVARWNGQTSGSHAFSVAQHCLLCDDIAQMRRKGLSRTTRLAVLLHDAAEYVVGDLISPFKAAVGMDYKAFEDRLRQAIHVRFDLPPRMSEDIELMIKRVDRCAAHLEAVQLAGFTPDEARRFFGPLRELEEITLTPLPAEQAKTEYMIRFRHLFHPG